MSSLNKINRWPGIEMFHVAVKNGAVISLPMQDQISRSYGSKNAIYFCVLCHYGTVLFLSIINELVCYRQCYIFCVENKSKKSYR